MDKREDKREDEREDERGIDDTVEHPEEIVQQTPPEGDPRPWISRNDEVPGTGRPAKDIDRAAEDADLAS